jgi:hypothetical protein
MTAKALCLLVDHNICFHEIPSLDIQVKQREGDFMRFKLFCLFIGFIGGYFMINWMPDVAPFRFTNFITEFIFNPLKSFLAMMSFFIGFLANAILIRCVIEEMIFYLSGREVRLRELIVSYGVVANFYFLFQMNVILTGLFLIFSLFYGIMSIDLQRKRKFKNNA